MLELNQLYYSKVCQTWPRYKSFFLFLFLRNDQGTSLDQCTCLVWEPCVRLRTHQKKKKYNKVSYFLLGSVGYDWRWAMRLWWWSAWQSHERDEYEREFFKCLGLLGGHYLDKLVTIFHHASCSSFSTCPMLITIEGKGTKKKKTKRSLQYCRNWYTIKKIRN